jgi:hypothetical protein
MVEQVRRVRLLVVVTVVGLLAFVVVPWPSPSAATEPLPLLLARETGAGRAAPAANTFVAVGDGPRLAAHLLRDGRSLADVEVIDATGRVVVLQANGQVSATGAEVDPAMIRSWLQSSFQVRARVVEVRVLGDTGDKLCSAAKQSARSRLTLPTHQGDRALTLAETLTEADRRLAAMHQPVNQIPERCVVLRDRDHRANYLHNLWHRITGTS